MPNSYTAETAGDKSFVRWYEAVPSLHQAFCALEKLPISTACGIATATLSLIENEDRFNKKQQGQDRTLGPDKVQGLLKSKHKRRWYDRDSTLHRVVNQIYILPEGQQTEIGVRICLALQVCLPIVVKNPGNTEASHKQHIQLVTLAFNDVIGKPLEILKQEAQHAKIKFAYLSKMSQNTLEPVKRKLEVKETNTGLQLQKMRIQEI
ncbi:MAG: hypothetical protein VKJ06_07280 [Vampirovibrionales bacterium]|nr:hypothetical protein [Vampirovibrionales bacterium]